MLDREIEELKGTTVAAEVIGNPRQEVIFLVEHPRLILPQQEPITVLRQWCRIGRINIPFSIFLKGGETAKLRFLGVAEELEFRRKTSDKPVSSVTAYDTRSYWGS